MATLNPVPENTPVPQLELDDDAIAGPGGRMNAQAQALANQLEDIRQNEIPRIDALENASADTAGQLVSLAAADADAATRLNMLESSQAGGAIGYATVTDLFADLDHDARTVALVTNDPDPDNNTNYRKEGAAGSGAWVKASTDRVSLVESAVATQATAVATNSVQLARVGSSLSVPNLFSLDEINVKGLPNLLLVSLAMTPTPDSVEGLPCWAFSTNAGDPSNTVRFAFDAAKFTSGKIAASAEFLRVSPVEGNINVFFQVTQHASNGATLASTQVMACGGEGLASAKTVAIPPIDKAEGAVSVRLVISASNTGGARTIKFRNLSISSGIPEFSMPPLQVPKVSIFPDPGLSGYATSTAQWSPAMETGNKILTAAGAGTLQQIWTVPKSDVTQPGDLLTWSAELFADAANACDLTLIQYDAAGVEISRQQANHTNAGNYQVVTTSLRIAANMARVDCRLVKRSAASQAMARRPIITTTSSDIVINTVTTSAPAGTGNGRTVVLIDAVTGSDVNDGVSAPVKSFTRAMQLAGTDTLLLVAAGDYTDVPTLSGVNSLEVRALSNAHVRLIGGTMITAATATEGTAKTYQVARGASPSGWLFYHDVPEASTLISDDDRLPIQGGREHRLPMSRIWPVASIADIDASDRASWYWESGVLYFSVPEGCDPNAGVYTPSGTVYPFSGGTVGQSVRAVGLQSFYFEKGFGPSGCVDVSMVDCRAFGAAVDGFAPDNCRFVRLTRCEGGGNNNDGSGGHQTNPATVLENCHYVGDECWYHDNWDDGESYHEGWTATDYGGMAEYNGDRGVVTANGGHSSHYNMRARSNGQNPTAATFNGGAGFCCAGTATDGGIGTQMALYGCISERNPINYSVNGVNSMDAFDCTSIDPGATHYMQSGGSMRLVDCRYSGNGTITSGTVNATSNSAVA